jgi:MFS family permease
VKDAVYRQYLLSVLLLVLAFNYVDRLALGLVLQDIKADLGLSDTQLGLLSGIAFALFYSVMGIPIARWADRGNRVTIISVTTLVWSVAVALCGLAGNFVQLLLIRVGVAVGEAGCVPPAHSLIADYFSRAERPRAVARYMLGVPLSAVIGYFGAGWLNEFYGWRMTFMILGLPGIALAMLARFTLREPRLTRLAADSGSTAAQPSVQELSATLWSDRTFRHLLLGYSVMAFFNYGITKWQPAFFIRSFGLQTGELGTKFAVIYGLGAMLGMYLGGELAARRASSNERRQLAAMAWVYCVFGLVSSGVYLSSTSTLAFTLLGIAAVGSAAVVGPLFATIQTLVPQRMRAMAIALVYLFANLIGMGLGPLAAGMLSDTFRPWAGDQSLRYALLALCPGYLWSAWHFWRASRTVTRDLEARATNV